MRGKRRSGVQRRVTFGQEEGKTKEWCPKKSCLWTVRRKNEGVVSEEELPLDRKKEKRRSPI
jgi:hypothetical protein